MNNKHSIVYQNMIDSFIKASNEYSKRDSLISDSDFLDSVRYLCGAMAPVNVNDAPVDPIEAAIEGARDNMEALVEDIARRRAEGTTKPKWADLPLRYEVIRTLAKVKCFHCDKELVCSVGWAWHYTSGTVRLQVRCHGREEEKTFDVDKWNKICEYGTWMAFL